MRTFGKRLRGEDDILFITFFISLSRFPYFELEIFDLINLLLLYQCLF